MSLAACFRLAKVPLCFLVSCSTLFGYLLANPIFSLQGIAVAGGIFFLAMGAATFNSVQEMSLDAQMLRTRERPLPQGRVRPFQAVAQATTLLALGGVSLSVSSYSTVPLLTAIGAIVLYNFVYTPLKKKSVLSIIPGAVSGAMPPYIGWLAAGGDAVSFGAGLLIALFVLWQVPHCWLVLLNHKQDYEEGPLPHLLETFDETALKRFFGTWIGALAIVMLMFRLIALSMGTIACILAVVNTLILALVFMYQLLVKQRCNYKLLFATLNIGLLLHMVFFAAGIVLA